MSKKKKYYWLKLQRDFFKRHDIMIIESQENGKDYVLFYLKLLVESIDHDGNLRFSESIPYDDKMLATITRTNIDIVRSAVKIFTELELMETMDDETIFMRDIEKMTGSESQWAEKKRIYRSNQKALEDKTAVKKEDIVLDVSKKVREKSSSSHQDVWTISDKSKSIESSSKEEEDSINNKKNKFSNYKQKKPYVSQPFNPASSHLGEEPDKPNANDFDVEKESAWK